MKTINKIVIGILIFVILISIGSLIYMATATAEGETIMYVTANKLNGRSSPAKRNNVEVIFEKGDWVEAISWSKDHKWIEVKGGESGTVWCSAKYLTERTDIFKVQNIPERRKVKIRKSPEKGSVTGYVKGGGTIEVQQVVFGWGRTKKGWIDLEYFVEVTENAR